ncbi:hypothetical protein OSB04_027793 [Centaurea solstitialis]|uniref:GATA-type domain-containing protein n=1 Tax=Centaurea solstitialis TaxID=347529 RepID=A0AA38SY15_9ASTR|nr:hypothetical protein OSB04_027793 [Centaurea solstitialis]
MDFCRNVSVSGGIPANYPPEQQLLSPSCSKLGSLDDLFSGHSMEEGDINTEWLSIFVEDCLSSSGSCIPLAMPLNPKSTTPNAQGTTTTTKTTKEEEEDHPEKEKQKNTHLGNNLSMHKLVVPCKARSKRRRKRSLQFKGTTPLSWAQDYNKEDPLLLHQAYWLADSELILTNNNNKSTSGNSSGSGDYGQGGYKQMKHEEEAGSQGRRCSHCLSQRTPQWRAGPQGPKTLCNACGVRYKSGRLLPEYRPAKSPTFVSYKHSNSHKKVLEMRMCSSSSS